MWVWQREHQEHARETVSPLRVCRSQAKEVLAQPLIKLPSCSLLWNTISSSDMLKACGDRDMFSADSHSSRFLLNSLSFLVSLTKPLGMFTEMAAELSRTI